MTHEEFIVDLWQNALECPKGWRLGQKVFNVCEDLYGRIARDVQFIDGVDCFYNDQKIDDFLNAVWERLKNDNN